MNNNTSTKGWIKNQDTGVKVSFLFNPEQFTEGKSTNFSDIKAPGMPYPNTQYINGNAREFAVSLFFYDNPYEGTIDEFRNFILSLMPPDNNNSGWVRPPQCIFAYGTFVTSCTLVSYEYTVEMYDNKIRPIQATFSLSFRQISDYIPS